MKSLKLILSAVKKSKWKSIWAGDWSLLACSDWGDNYIKTLTVGGKPFLKQVIFLSHNGKSSAWADEKDVENFSKRILINVNGKLSKIKTLSNLTKKETKKALSFMEQNKNHITPKIYKQYLKIIRDYYLPHRQVKYIVDVLPEKLLKKFLPVLQKARLFAEPVFTKTIEFDKKFVSKISKNTGVKPELLLYLTQKELDIYFKNGKIPKNKKLLARHKLSALIFMNKTYELYSGQDACRVEKAMIQQTKTSKLQGFCAFPGKVKGRVKVVTDPAKVKDFKQGNILAASMTRPEYLPLMKKAAAFITDAGGVLSHAAIVAREMKKPCIIGTKIATKILKDGDLVDVDAVNGMVKILKR